MNFKRIADACMVDQGFRAPAGFGLAWIEYDTARAVFLPIPFNWLAALLRRVYFILCAGHPLKHDKELRTLLQRAEENGRKAGYTVGFEAGYRKKEQEIEMRLNALKSPYSRQMFYDYINGRRDERMDFKKE